MFKEDKINLVFVLQTILSVGSQSIRTKPNYRRTVDFSLLFYCLTKRPF